MQSIQNTRWIVPNSPDILAGNSNPRIKVVCTSESSYFASSNDFTFGCLNKNFSGTFPLGTKPFRFVGDLQLLAKTLSDQLLFGQNTYPE